MSETVEEATARDGRPNRWLLVTGAGLAVFAAMLDMYIVNTALPVIGAEMGAGPGVTEWVVLGYLLPLVALSLSTGRWLDRVGRRSALTLSTVGIAVASVAAGLAPSVGWLIAARVLQGVFSVMLLALSPVLATVAVRPQARGRAMSVVTTLGPLGGIAGPVVGGFVVEALGWPWVFYANVPICLAVLLLGFSQLPADAPLRLPGRAWWLESAVFGGAATAFVVGMSLATSHDLRWLGLTLLAVPLLAVWLRLETSSAVRELLARSSMAGPHVALLATATITGLLVFLGPFYLQRELGVSAAASGVTLLALPLATGLLGFAAGALADMWGARRIALGGTVVLSIGVALFAPLGMGWSTGEVAWRLVVIGVGTGLFLAPNQTMAMSMAPGHLLTTVAASTQLARQSGFLLGPAVAAAAWAASGHTVTGMRAAVGIAAALGLLACAALVAMRRAGASRRKRDATSPP